MGIGLTLVISKVRQPLENFTHHLAILVWKVQHAPLLHNPPCNAFPINEDTTHHTKQPSPRRTTKQGIRCLLTHLTAHFKYSPLSTCDARSCTSADGAESAMRRCGPTSLRHTFDLPKLGYHRPVYRIGRKAAVAAN